MIKLSIEEKAKRYDGAIERARIWREKSGMPNDRKGVLDDIFPELKESEDEQIRKEMIEILKKEARDFPSSVIAEKSNSWIVWLEKQGAELSVYQNVLFKIATILSQHEDKEDSPLEQIRSIVVDGLVSAMDIDKQGEQKPEEIVNLHDYLFGEQNPVSIEMKTPEESLGIDSDTYNKIVNECVYGNTEQKPAWSEEDETTRNNISHIIRQYDKISKRENKPCWYIGNCLLWMQNIKDRVFPQSKQELSDWDKTIIESIEALCDEKIESVVYQDVKQHVNDIKGWLKNLKERYTWKPNKAQIEAIEDAIEFLGCTEKVREDLKSLHEQLKKLKG